MNKDSPKAPEKLKPDFPKEIVPSNSDGSWITETALKWAPILKFIILGMIGLVAFLIRVFSVRNKLAISQRLILVFMNIR